MAETVFIVRDVEERYIKGVYRHQADAEPWRRATASDISDEPENSDDWSYVRDQYEILEMPIE